MRELRIESISDPFDSPELAAGVVGLLADVVAMGVVSDGEPIRGLDRQIFRRVLADIARAGVGATAVAALQGDRPLREAQLTTLIHELRDALAHSPLPRFEWPALIETLEADRLAVLLNVSVSSLKRYSSGQRSTPDAVADRLHLLARIVGYLAGAYNEIGIRRWFDRTRTQLHGKSPSRLLRGDWKPESAGPTRVFELARSLAASPAT